MTAQEYINDGFNLSLHIDQNKINRAERLAMQNYIKPIAGDEPNAEQVRSALMATAFLILLQNTLAETRAGAKIKNTPQSNNAEDYTILSQWAIQADAELKQLRNITGNHTAKINDVAKIYFKTQYFHN